jgi:hypothetical protein
MCTHLLQLENHLKQNNIKETYRGTAWGDEFGEWVYFACRMNLTEARTKFLIPEFVETHTNDDARSGLEAGFYCPQCKYAVMTAHPKQTGDLPTVN